MGKSTFLESQQNRMPSADPDSDINKPPVELYRPEVRLDELKKEAGELMNSSQFQEAVGVLKQALQIVPHCPDIQQALKEAEHSTRGRLPWPKPVDGQKSWGVDSGDIKRPGRWPL